MPKLYTKQGDKGITSLYDGNKISKSAVVFDVLGNLDELSSHIGLLCAHIKEDRRSKIESKDKETYVRRLRMIQINLLDIGSNIAVINESKKKDLVKITGEEVRELEELIDYFESKNSKLTEFLLPGYYLSDAQCHVCRSVTRKVERSMWLHHNSGIVIDESILKYVNRLSDLFFALSRNLSNGKDVKVKDI